MKLDPGLRFPSRVTHFTCLGLLFLKAMLVGMGMGWAAGKLPGLMTGAMVPSLVAFAYFVWRKSQEEE